MPATSRRLHLTPPIHTRLRAGVPVVVTAALVAGVMAATAVPAFADRGAHADGGRLTSSTLLLDLGHHPAATHAAPLLPQRARATVRNGPGHGARGTTGHGTDTHGNDTHGRDGSARDRELALAATWEVDPTLLEPQPGDSAATLDARAELGTVTDRMHVVMGRYDKARATAQDAAVAADDARADLKEARADAAAAHRTYVRDHRLLVELVTEGYEQPPVTSMQIFLTADNAHDMLLVMGTMQQLGSNQASVVTEAEAATVTMNETAARARLADDAARRADAKAHTALAAATDAGEKVLGQLDRARHLVTLSVLADQMQTALAHAMEYAKHLKPGSVSFPLPRNSGFYDNHNWGERSRHWASIHTGDDYSVACGTPVLAATAGKIEILTDQRWAGRWLVMVSTGPGRLTTWYAHMGALAVTPGQRVKPGQIIGAVGDAGNATGCHLHFELHPDGGSIYQDSTDPDPWLKAVGAYPGS